MRKPSLCIASSMLLLAVLTGCASPSTRVRVDQSEGGLPDCRTFAWHAISGDAASLSDQRVRAAVMAQLKSKGYEEAAEKPDCRIAYHMRTSEIPKAKPRVGVGVGGGSGGIGGGVGVSLPVGRRPAFTGTFTLDVIDATKNEQVWSGAIDVELAEAELSDEEAQRLAKEVLSAYPNAASGARN
jgi:hypothetical protein